MSGYLNFSKSNNAIEAEAEGLLPASIIAKKLNVTTEAVISVMKPDEWHHTSCKFNRTNYYSIEEAVEKIDELKNFISKKINKKYIADVEFIEWSGSRNFPRKEIFNYKNIEVEERGSFYFLKVSEKQIIKKKISGNYIKVFNKQII